MIFVSRFWLIIIYWIVNIFALLYIWPTLNKLNNNDNNNSLEEPNFFSLIATKLACRNDGGGGSWGYVQVMSADSCRMRRIEGVWTVELVYVAGQLRMGGDSLLLPVWRSVGDGFTGNGESDEWVVRAGTWQAANLHGSRMGYLP